MNRIALIVAILAYSIFAADTLYLRNGKEIKDASIVEIGVSDVKYKVGKKDVLYTVKKSDIAIIFFADGTKEVFEAESKSDATTGQNIQIVQTTQQTVQNTANAGSSTPSTEAKDRYKNFTTGRRWGTWALNAFTISGLGSWLIMGDVVGGFVHLGLDVAAVISFYASETEDCSSGYYYSSCTTEYDPTLFAIFYISGAVWNIYRSASYDKPKSHTSLLDPSNFNFAVLPNRRGNLMPAVLYNKTF
ncbi:hypothetical protein R83H12_00584 [Fibrobacteria bacterium R8-3-H12]